MGRTRRRLAIVALAFVLSLIAALFAPVAHAQNEVRKGWCAEGEGQSVVIDWSQAPEAEPIVRDSSLNHLIRCLIFADPDNPSYDSQENGRAAVLADIGIDYEANTDSGVVFVTSINGISAEDSGWKYSGVSGDDLSWDNQLYNPNPNMLFVGIAFNDDYPNVDPQYAQRDPTPSPSSSGPGPSDSPSSSGPSSSPSASGSGPGESASPSASTANPSPSATSPGPRRSNPGSSPAPSGSPTSSGGRSTQPGTRPSNRPSIFPRRPVPPRPNPRTRPTAINSPSPSLSPRPTPSATASPSPSPRPSLSPSPGQSSVEGSAQNSISRPTAAPPQPPAQSERAVWGAERPERRERAETPGYDALNWSITIGVLLVIGTGASYFVLRPKPSVEDSP